jgi:hypothetical protein
MSEEQKLADLLAGPTKPPRSPPEQDPTEELETIGEEEEQPKGQVMPAASAVAAGNLFRHPEAHPIVLDLALLHKYGPEWYAWETETLELRIPQDFHVKEVSDMVMSKIQAVRTLHMVDSFWSQWEVFGWCTMAFNGVFPDFDVLQVPTVAECMISVDIANQIRSDVEWHPELKAYLESVHRHDGIFVTQPPLEFVHLDLEDLVLDGKEIRMLWPVVRDSNNMPTGETITAEQLRRMLSAHRALEESRVSMRTQLPLVQHV